MLKTSDILATVTTCRKYVINANLSILIPSKSNRDTIATKYNYDN